MKIGIASPISSFYLQEFLDERSANIASKLSNHDAPAVTNLVQTFLQFGHDVYIFTKDPEASSFIRLRGEHLTINIVPSSRKGWRKLLNKFCVTDLFLIIKMYCSSQSFDVLSVHWTRDYAIGARKYFGKCPVTCTVRDILPLISKMQPIRKIVRLQNEITMRCSKYHFIANSEYTQSMINKYWGRKSIVIPNGISKEFIEYSPIKKNDTYTFASISTVIDGRKNIEVLIKAFSSFRNKYPSSKMMLIGPCFVDSNDSIKRWKEMGLLDGVELMGRKNRKEIKTLLSQCHCLVHPALEETFGNILIEAMACKCLVIGGNVSGAVPFVLHHGELGLLCDVTDEHSLESAMISAHAGNFYQIIEKAFKSAHNEYSPDAVAKKYIDYFETLINDRR